MKIIVSAVVCAISFTLPVAALDHPNPEVPARIAIFSPGGISPQLVGKVATAHIEVVSPSQLEGQFRQVIGSRTKLDLDLGSVLGQIRPVAQIKTEYSVSDQRQHKLLAPLEFNKLRNLPSDTESISILRPYMDLIRRYQDQVATVFVADEPYLNGISKEELERVAKTLRTLFSEYQIKDVQLGLIFASGMVNADFARLVDREASQYVRSIDQHYEILSEKAWKSIATPEELQWLQHIQKHRLATYDSANNMYVEGGLPQGYDVFGFDFYLGGFKLEVQHRNPR